jgi:hypothetical protein
MASETKKTAEGSKKAMGAFRISQGILDNLKKIAQETGIPASTIVSRCLEVQKVKEVTRKHLEESLAAMD